MKFKYKRHIIDNNALGDRRPNCAVGDLTGDGTLDMVMGTHVCPQVDGEKSYLSWYQNPNWSRHIIDQSTERHFHLGLTIFDINGDGRNDIISALDRPPGLFWYENTGAPENPFVKHEIEDNLNGFIHDIIFSDINGDKKAELIASTPRGNHVFYYEIPDDPTGKWKQQTIYSGETTEGLLVKDFRGDNLQHLFAGPCCFINPGNKNAGNSWGLTKVSENYREACRLGWVKLNNGREGVVICEAEYGDGRISWFEHDQGEWTEQSIDRDVYFGHSLTVKDIDGDGNDEIFVGEMAHGGYGAEAKNNARLMIYKCTNPDKNKWERHIISEGVGTHEAHLCDAFNNGRQHILGKVWRDKHVDWWEPVDK